LPDHNTPYGKIIAETVDDLPSSVSAIVYSCCWGEWGQPEPKGIEYVVRHQRSIQFVPRDAFSCELLRAAGREVYVVWDPREAGAAITPITCDPAAAPEVHSGENGRTVFLSYRVGR
jgi:hypothetical protein